jgi:NAD(P)-dependent dehydrogenase (short-subunit alcohol dehydrogenase family)
VLAVARQEAPLRQLIQQVPGVEALSLDAADEGAPAKVFDVLPPDILVVSAGALPPAAPLFKQSWREFAVNWETDVKIAFHFCKAALSRPLPAGSSVILIASGAAFAGSPNSGGYAGAKRTQIFMANYSQKESDRLGLGLRFMALAPRIMPDTELGKHAVAGYSRIRSRLRSKHGRAAERFRRCDSGCRARHQGGSSQGKSVHRLRERPRSSGLMVRPLKKLMGGSHVCCKDSGETIRPGTALGAFEGNV